MTPWALSSWPRVVCILHILEMFRFHHSSHLWVASNWHHEPESILIGYPFRTLSSQPRVDFHLWSRVISFPFRAQSSRLRVIFLIYDLESFFPFKALSSWPGVIHFIYDPESFLALIALSSWPRVVYPIFDLESFILFLTQSHSSYPWPRVIHLIHDFESSFSPLSIFVLIVTYLYFFTIIPPT